ncbi:cache domain-containing protein [Desulfococcaceae bacterium HSG9]|nr:cache domain-containing protein [Desulfococcaceae bacterium HSG9]
MLTSIKSKILLLIVALMTVTILTLIFVTKKNFEIELKYLHHKLAQDALQSAKKLIDREYGELTSYKLTGIARRRELMTNMSAGVLAMLRANYELYTSAVLTEDEAKANSLRWINTFRYGVNQYFFVCDMDLLGLSHPLETMVGKTWTGFTDVKLEDALLLMREVIEEENGGFTVFRWPALANQALVKQMGCFSYFPEWGWMLGTTARIDDLERDSHKAQNLMVAKLESIFLHTKFVETGHFFLFNGSGEMLIHPKISKNRMSYDVLIQLAKAGAEHPETPIEYIYDFTEERAQKYFMYVTYFRPLDWYVATLIPHNAIMGPVDRLAIRQAYIMIAILFGGIIIAGILGARITRPLEALSRYARDLSAKDLSAKDVQPEFKCAANSYESKQLADSFLFMEDQLIKQLKELTDYREHLEYLVETRTKALREAQEELIRKERMAVLGHFSGSISHELQNPLGVIDSSVYYLKMKLGNSDEKVEQHLKRITSGVHSATAIVRSLLNLTRMKTPDAERYDLVALVSESLDSCKIPDTVTLDRNFPDTEFPVKAEREQIRMALKNIVKNGIEAMNGAGNLAVTIRKTASKQAELIFQDTGAGIQPEDIDKIFHPLFSRKTTGIGFGLSLTKMIIENHGGTIAAESEPGKGAAFIITLPLVEEGD